MELEILKRADLEKKIENWHRSTGFNRMCFECPLIGTQCRGGRTDRWHDCVKRNFYERKQHIKN